MYTGFKIEIHPSQEQEEYLLHCCRCYHDLWNLLVSKFKDNLPHRVSNQRIATYTDIDFQKEFPYKIPKRIYRSVMHNYCNTLINYYKKRIKNPPKFHKYNPNKQSFYIIDTHVNIVNYTIKLPIYNGCKVSKNIELPVEYIKVHNIQTVYDVHYTHYKNKWYISGFYKTNGIQKSNIGKMLGLDWGIKNFMTASNGMLINYPRSVLRRYERIKALQSHLSRKRKGSNNYNKLLNKLQKAWDNMNNIKLDFVEKTTTKLAIQYHIAVEDIDLKYSLLPKYKFIRQYNAIYPRHLFVDKLRWKCEKFGKYYVVVDPRYTSQYCCRCGYLHKIKLSERVFHCEVCGNGLNRDVNAAINIKERGKLILSQMGVCCIH